MRLSPFKLDQWLNQHENGVRYNLAVSTGPRWTAAELAALMTEQEKERLAARQLVYTPANGTEELRSAIARRHDVSPEDVLVLTGASEALVAMFFLIAESGVNVVVPDPAFPPFAELPRAMGIEVRPYPLRRENGYAIDPGEIRRRIDSRTRLLLLNTPHNPTGAVAGSKAIAELHDFAVERNIWFVVDEVYHPVYHGEPQETAATLPGASLLGDMSKAYCLSGLRVGWLIERNRERRERVENARAYFTISNGPIAEALAALALRNSEAILSRARRVANENLSLLDGFFSRHRSRLEWTRPRGGFTAFPRLLDRSGSRPFCEKAAERGVLLAPGDCFGFPEHFRLGFGACEAGFGKALEILSEILAGERG